MQIEITPAGVRLIRLEHIFILAEVDLLFSRVNPNSKSTPLGE